MHRTMLLNAHTAPNHKLHNAAKNLGQIGPTYRLEIWRQLEYRINHIYLKRISKRVLVNPGHYFDSAVDIV